MVIKNKIKAAKLSLSKKNAILAYAVKKGVPEASKKYGIASSTIYYWKSISKQGYLHLLEPTVTRQTFDEETKLKAVIEYQSGKFSKIEICNKYGIRGSLTLDRWLERYNKPDTISFLRKNKALGVKTSYTSDFKINFVTRVSQGAKTAALARELGVPKTTAYEWVNAFNQYGAEYFKESNLIVTPVEASSVQDHTSFKILAELSNPDLHPDALVDYKLKCAKLKEQYPGYAEFIDRLAQHTISLLEAAVEAKVKSGTLKFLDTVKKELDSKKAKSKK